MKTFEDYEAITKWWRDTKTCPICGEPNKLGNVLCEECRD